MYHASKFSRTEETTQIPSKASPLSGAWSGYYIQSLERRDMGQFALHFTLDGLAHGKGVDGEGPYIIGGKMDQVRQVVVLEKTSSGGPKVTYSGRLVDVARGLRGTWQSEGDGGVFYFVPADHSKKVEKAAPRHSEHFSPANRDLWLRGVLDSPFSFAVSCPGNQEIVLAAVRVHGHAMEYASEELKADRDFLLEAVRQTKASWLLHFAAPELREDPGFRAECDWTAGTGLVFTYYASYDCLDYMRKSFPTAVASVPGGEAYEEVIKKVTDCNEGSTATVWFDQQLVFGHVADGGKWLHPSYDCGRDNVPVPPPGERDRKWEALVESRSHRREPQVGERFPCWCCHWIRLVRQRHAEGCVICCTVSNIFSHTWVERFGAGSSELSDEVADQLQLPRERFRNGRPERNGCRWERSVLDNMDFPVYAFFMP
ncbi:hypothetical protein AK812_SmicGene15288 [Symbiodinium microadriaticum]|uniref:DUF4116 domain-containing protein n=1 Tax=Symbiodinium microadriaticum TaxID=2951 RepID=A0A1Q9E3D3_SYMMI|nr:hypothetical protein AK812_SmicGene15288 [Symbiodinium microadriaticum]